TTEGIFFIENDHEFCDCSRLFA
ncbi:hypothetical protein A2U01_0114171, partial [Trifolium medium]|nr:hypothetical protein [Trifolium medium]